MRRGNFRTIVTPRYANGGEIDDNYDGLFAEDDEMADGFGGDSYDEYGTTDDILDGDYDEGGGLSMAGGDTGPTMSGLPFEILSGRKEAAQAGLRQARERLMVSMQGPQRDDKAKWLAMAAGFLSPTRTGSTFESVGNAAGNLAPLVDRYANEDAAMRSKLAELDYANAVDDYKLASAKPEIIDTYTADGGRQKAILVDGVPVPFGGTLKPRSGSAASLLDKYNQYQELLDSGKTPEEIDRALGRTKPGSTTVNINDKTELEFDKKAGEAAVDDLKSQKEALGKIIDVGNQMPVLASAVDESPDEAFGPQGGFFSDFVTTAKGLGFDIDAEGKWSNREFANTLISRMVPMQRVAGSGSASDADMRLFKSALPDLTGSKQGVQKAMLYWDRMANYARQKQDLVNKALNNRNYALNQYQQDVNDLDAKGIFSDEDRAILKDRKAIKDWTKGLSGTGGGSGSSGTKLSPEQKKRLDDLLRDNGIDPTSPAAP